jgi:undecaprenyl pyrophosphate synthase
MTDTAFTPDPEMFNVLPRHVAVIMDGNCLMPPRNMPSSQSDVPHMCCYFAITL